MRLRILELPMRHLGEASETPYALIFDRCSESDGQSIQRAVQALKDTPAEFHLAFRESVELGEGEPDALVALTDRREPPPDNSWIETEKA